jgi:hypothetical protein
MFPAEQKLEMVSPVQTTHISPPDTAFAAKYYPSFLSFAFHRILRIKIPS